MVQCLPYNHGALDEAKDIALEKADERK
jgi:hypothetical protein